MNLDSYKLTADSSANLIALPTGNSDVENLLNLIGLSGFQYHEFEEVTEQVASALPRETRIAKG